MRFLKKIIPYPLISLYHFKLALLAAFIYGFPGKKIKVIGVTGTSGKSTVVEMISKILEESGFKTASLSSIRFKIDKKEWINDLKMTMPGRFKIQKFLYSAVKENCQFAVIEVTSEGIKQHRHRFINFDTAVFTNLSPEHIESHGGFENYRNEKLKLFKACRNVHVINTDDENAKFFWEIDAKKKYDYGIKKAEDINVSENGIKFKVNNVEFNLNLIGEFNVYNALAAIFTGLSHDIPLETCARALDKIKTVAGRMEVVVSKPFKVIVDYAHTSEQLKKTYESLKDNNLICVLGSCGGGRDKWKRPILGEIANEYCSKVIITNEDPYDDDPMEIITDVAKGAEKALKILDRKQAIKEALQLAKPNDIVVITGKGSEPWMCVENGKKIPWSDKNIVLTYSKTSV